jgi:peptidoglycan glycosyltransferase
MLAAVYVFGTENYGAKNWISIKGIVFQPSEFVKIIYVFFLASFLSKFRDFKHVVIIGIMAAVHVGILVLEKDLGGALLFFITFLFMLFVATGKKRYLLAGFGGGAAASVVAYKMFSHVRIRVMAFIDPWSHIDNEGYQVTQSLFAIGTGGLLGMGFSEGAPEDIPVVASDFIFAAIAEEFGTFFGICLILLEICMFMMFVRISLSMRKVFYKLVALGLSIEYITQTLLNLGGVTKFLPSTGVTLPLISYGGSSIISTIFMIFIVQGMYILSMDQEEEEMKNEGRKEA